MHVGTITSLSSQGQGIIRQEDGYVVFVPFTAPGDKIRYRIAKDKKNFALGVLEEVIDPSPVRVLPKCPYFGTCGGCQLQHLSYVAQTDVKRQLIVDALSRIGGFSDVVVPPVIAAKEEWEYRRRVNFRLKPVGSEFKAGYTATDNFRHLPVDQCPIFTLSDAPVMVLQQIASRLKPADGEEGRATVLKTEGGRYLFHLDFKEMPQNVDTILDFRMESVIAAISISSPKRTLKIGNTDIHMDIDGFNISFSAKAFVQAHPEQSLKIYQAIEKAAHGIKPLHTLDLYSGIGISSLFVARAGSHVIGIESNQEAVRLARHNAKKNNYATLSFIAADVGAVLQKQLEMRRYDLVIVNPPREGLASEVVEALKNFPAKALIYISCMPSTLARDLKILCQKGYEVASLQPYDMFPQTIHVETMAVLTHR